MTGLEYIRWFYGVVYAREGARVVYRDLPGVITGGENGCLIVKLDDIDDEAVVHPKAVSYLDDIEVPA